MKHCTDIREWRWRWLRSGCTSNQCCINSKFHDRQFISNTQLVSENFDVGWVVCSTVLSLCNMPEASTSDIFTTSFCVCLHSLTCPCISTPCSSCLWTWQSGSGSRASPGIQTSSRHCCLWLGTETFWFRQASVLNTTWCTNQNTYCHQLAAKHCAAVITNYQKLTPVDKLSTYENRLSGQLFLQPFYIIQQ